MNLMADRAPEQLIIFGIGVAGALAALACGVFWELRGRPKRLPVLRRPKR